MKLYEVIILYVSVCRLLCYAHETQCPLGLVCLCSSSASKLLGFYVSFCVTFLPKLIRGMPGRVFDLAVDAGGI